MTPQPPPLDATPFLNDKQQRELSCTPPQFRLLGAWLIVLRDDYLGQWSTRPVPCVECVGQRLPCLDKAGRESSARCEGCRLNGYSCGNGDNHDHEADESRPLSDRISSKKRKLGSVETESSLSALASIDSKLDIPEDMESASVVPEAAVASSPKPREASPTTGSIIDPSALPTFLPAKPIAPLGVHQDDEAEFPYDLNHVRSILDKARRLSQANGCHVNVSLDQSIQSSDFQHYDHTVLVRPPGSLPTWLVVFVDHRARRGTVLFDDRGVRGRLQRPAQVCVERAFSIFHKAITFEAEVYPCLNKDSEGSFHATALAVDLILNGSDIARHELVVHRNEALEQHRMLLNGIWHPYIAATVGRRSKVVARISRHERRFEWVNGDGYARR